MEMKMRMMTTTTTTIIASGEEETNGDEGLQDKSNGEQHE